jgi:hypothetical protein
MSILQVTVSHDIYMINKIGNSDRETACPSLQGLVYRSKTLDDKNIQERRMEQQGQLHARVTQQK